MLGRKPSNTGNDLPEKIKFRRKQRRVASVLSVFVAAVTLFAMILPAVTLNGPHCDKAEHTHSTQCYTTVTHRVLDCNCDTLGIHHHTANCYGVDDHLICNQVDFVVHTHDEACYDDDGCLICTLKEVHEHRHNASCYSMPEISTELSYIDSESNALAEAGTFGAFGDEENTGEPQSDFAEPDGLAEEPSPVLTCTRQEVILHTHDNCCEYDSNGNVTALLCGHPQITAHQHNEACSTTVEETVLVCEFEEHTHGEECFAATELTAAQQAKVAAVTELIAALPTMEEVEAKMAELDVALAAYSIDNAETDTDNGNNEEVADTQGEEDYFAALFEQVNVAYEQYIALSEEERLAVANSPTLMQFDWMLVQTLEANAAPTNIQAYLSELAGSEFAVTLKDKNDNVITGNATVYKDEDYTLSVYAATGAANGFVPGTYTYQLPSDFMTITPINADLLDEGGVIYGSYSIAENGLVTFDFNEGANGKTNVKILSSTTVQFTEEVSDIPFVGDVVLNVIPNPNTPSYDEPLEASIRKTGKIKTEEGVEKIEWYLRVQGGSKGDGNYTIVGKTVTDTLLDNTTIYTDDDKSIWAEVYTGVNNSLGNEIYYSWSIKDANDYTGYRAATWTENSWTYTVPATVQCHGCNDPAYSELVDGKWVHKLNSGYHYVELGDNWRTCFYFDSTITNADANKWENTASAGELETTGAVYPATGAGIIKTGTLDAETGKFKWTIEATIPGGIENDFYWYIWDSISLPNTTYEVPNDLDKATVEVLRNDGWVTVPHLLDATANDLFAFSTWAESNESHGEELDFLRKCTCTAETCAKWGNGGCQADVDAENEDGHWVNSADGTLFCRCWVENTDTTFRVTYFTEASSYIIGEYGGIGHYISNYVSMSYKTPRLPGQEKDPGHNAGEDSDYIPIPGVFNKQLIREADQSTSYVADFKITVNEDMKDLSSETQDNIVIRDEMTTTLYYQHGSMVITKTDVLGNTTRLTQGMDYELSMEDPHTVLITILHPGQFKYTLNYSAILDVTQVTSSGITYNNSATVTLHGVTYSATIGQESLNNVQYSAENHAVTVVKKAEGDNTPLQGATFKLCNEEGNIIATGETNSNGSLTFATNVTAGIMFKNDTLYYLQETKAPAGFILDDGKHWFYFANNANSELDNAYDNVRRFPKAEAIYTGTVEVSNRYGSVVLPNTGGTGKAPYIIGGAAAMTAVAMLMYIKTDFSGRRKRNSS